MLFGLFMVGYVQLQCSILSSANAEVVKWTPTNAQLDSVPDCRILVAPIAGVYHLDAEYGNGIGPKIKYMEEWKAFGYFNESDRIEWLMDAAQDDLYEVFLEWSAEGSVVGNPYQIIVGNQKLDLQVEDSGSWEVFKRKKIGELQIPVGIHRLTVQPDPQVEKGGYMDVRKVELVMKK